MKGQRRSPADVAEGPAPEGWRRCTCCRRLKVLRDFQRDGEPPRPRCRNCARLASAAYRQGAKFRATIAAYRARPEVRERRKTLRRDWPCESRERIVAAENTPRGKVLKARRQARYQLKRATDPARIARLKSLIRQAGEIIARMDRLKEAS
jgi:hypothetical protein